ncbi:MAG: sulfurtransferase TusA family protein [Pseudomonadota bacterium]
MRLENSSDYTVDVRGAITPFSLLKVSLVFEQMKPLETLEILGCDAEMQQDLLRLLPKASCECIRADAPRGTSEMPRVRFRKEPENR